VAAAAFDPAFVPLLKRLDRTVGRRSPGEQVGRVFREPGQVHVDGLVDGREMPIRGGGRYPGQGGHIDQPGWSDAVFVGEAANGIDQAIPRVSPVGSLGRRAATGGIEVHGATLSKWEYILSYAGNMTFHFAELNIARLLQPLDHADNAEFVAVLDAVNAIAEVSDGFVWRLQDDNGRSASYVTVYDDPLLIVNMSVWESPEALRHFVYRSGHSSYLRRRKEWFGDATGEQMVCWWIPGGEVPDVHDAASRLERLQTQGPSDNGFAFADAASWLPGTVEA
jgi:hypothetical protein